MENINKNYEELTDVWLSLMNKVRETTWTNYGLNGNLMPISNWKNVVEDLMNIIEEKNKEIEKIIEDRDANYRKISIAEQVCDERC